jgi:hypothetical protein
MDWVTPEFVEWETAAEMTAYAGHWADSEAEAGEAEPTA